MSFAVLLGETCLWPSCGVCVSIMDWLVSHRQPSPTRATLQGYLREVGASEWVLGEEGDWRVTVTGHVIQFLHRHSPAIRTYVLCIPWVVVGGLNVRLDLVGAWAGVGPPHLCAPTVTCPHYESRMTGVSSGCSQMSTARCPMTRCALLSYSYWQSQVPPQPGSPTVVAPQTRAPTAKNLTTAGSIGLDRRGFSCFKIKLN